MDAHNFAVTILALIVWVVMIGITFAFLAAPFLGRESWGAALILLGIALFFWALLVARFNRESTYYGMTSMSDHTAWSGFAIIFAGISWVLLLAPLLKWGYKKLMNKPVREVVTADAHEMVEDQY